jgi:hypothetical protein
MACFMRKRRIFSRAVFNASESNRVHRMTGLNTQVNRAAGPCNDRCAPDQRAWQISDQLTNDLARLCTYAHVYRGFLESP